MLDGDLSVTSTLKQSNFKSGSYHLTLSPPSDHESRVDHKKCIKSNVHEIKSTVSAPSCNDYAKTNGVILCNTFLKNWDTDTDTDTVES